MGANLRNCNICCCLLRHVHNATSYAGLLLAALALARSGRCQKVHVITMEHQYVLCLNILKNIVKRIRSWILSIVWIALQFCLTSTNTSDILKHDTSLLTGWIKDCWTMLSTSPCPRRFEVKVPHLPKRPGFQWVANCHSRPRIRWKTFGIKLASQTHPSNEKVYNNQEWYIKNQCGQDIWQTHFGEEVLWDSQLNVRQPPRRPPRLWPRHSGGNPHGSAPRPSPEPVLRSGHLRRWQHQVRTASTVRFHVSSQIISFAFLNDVTSCNLLL